MNAKSQRASASTLTTYEATRTLGQDVRKVFSADLEQNTSPSVWSRRMGVRGAKQIPPTGWRLGLAGHGSDPQPPGRDGSEQEQDRAPPCEPGRITLTSRGR